MSCACTSASSDHTVYTRFRRISCRLHLWVLDCLLILNHYRFGRARKTWVEFKQFCFSGDRILKPRLLNWDGQLSAQWRHKNLSEWAEKEVTYGITLNNFRGFAVREIKRKYRVVYVKKQPEFTYVLNQSSTKTNSATCANKPRVYF